MNVQLVSTLVIKTVSTVMVHFSVHVKMDMCWEKTIQHVKVTYIGVESRVFKEGV